MEELRALQKKREELRVKLKEAEARYDLAMVADLKCAPGLPRTVAGMLFLRPCRRECSASTQCLQSTANQCHGR